MKSVSQLDSNGYFVGPAIADESPLEPGVVLLPAGCIDVPPFEVPAGKMAKWTGTDFVLEAIPTAEPAPVPPPPTPAQLKAEAEATIQLRLDTFARRRGYDSLLSACSYLTSSVPKFAAEAKVCLDARDATWIAANELLASVDPTNLPTIDQVVAAMPALVWPA